GYKNQSVGVEVGKNPPRCEELDDCIDNIIFDYIPIFLIKISSKAIRSWGTIFVESKHCRFDFLFGW
ncbi:hypothetical protein A2U01_0114404, partial [Trifolium medium]|nr:hypothetical protein [Trifolium medium]